MRILSLTAGAGQMYCGSCLRDNALAAEWLALAQPADLTVLPNSLLISLAAPIARATRRPVGVTLQGEDLFLDGLEEPYRTESLRLIREHAASVDGFFAVSRFYAPVMARLLNIEPSRIHVIPLGITTRDIEPRGPRGAAPPRIGFFGRIAPEKGLHVLCEAYRALRESGRLPEATLEAGGYLGPEHRRYLPGNESRMKAWGLSTEFHYHGALDRSAK